jgi:NTE family protein
MTIQQPARQPEHARYQVGLALSGGGARGFAHIGVLKALEEYQIHPDLVAGVSAGSVVAAFYCAGLTADEILTTFEGESFSSFASISVPSKSLFRLDGFREFLTDTLGSKRIEQMPTPLRIVATDLDHGTSHIFDEGRTADAVRASCSIPVIFPPVIIDGVCYVDGGVLRNFPVLPIRRECDFIIGVNVNPLHRRESYHHNLLGIAERTYSLMFRSNSVEDCELADMLIEPEEVGDYGVFNTKFMHKIVDTGYRAAVAVLEEYRQRGIITL